MKKTLQRFSILLVVSLLSGCDNKNVPASPPTPSAPSPTGIDFGWVVFIAIAAFLIGIAIGYAEASHDTETETEHRTKRVKRTTDGLDKIVTSSTDSLLGHRAVRNVKFISLGSDDEQDIAEIDFLTQVKAAGANGVINMKIIRQDEGFLIEGDSVVAEPLP